MYTGDSVFRARRHA